MIDGMTKQRITETNNNRYECRNCQTDILKNVGILEQQNIGMLERKDTRINIGTI